MALVFSIGFVYIGWGSVKVVEDIKLKFPDSALVAERYHTVSFIACVTALVAWISDTIHCDFWQHLPMGLPYPQLYATGWHLCMLLTLLWLIVSLQQHRCQQQGDCLQNLILLPSGKAKCE